MPDKYSSFIDTRQKPESLQLSYNLETLMRRVEGGVGEEEGEKKKKG